MVMTQVLLPQNTVMEISLANALDTKKHYLNENISAVLIGFVF